MKPTQLVRIGNRSQAKSAEAKVQLTKIPQLSPQHVIRVLSIIGFGAMKKAMLRRASRWSRDIGVQELTWINYISC
jgi:hypothetical protein